MYHLSLSVVSHDIAIKECRKKMGEAYELNKRLKGLISDEDLENLKKRNSEEDQRQNAQTKRKRQTLIDWIQPQ